MVPGMHPLHRCLPYRFQLIGNIVAEKMRRPQGTRSHPWATARVASCGRPDTEQTHSDGQPLRIDLGQPRGIAPTRNHVPSIFREYRVPFKYLRVVQIYSPHGQCTVQDRAANTIAHLRWRWNYSSQLLKNVLSCLWPEERTAVFPEAPKLFPIRDNAAYHIKETGDIRCRK